MTDATPSNEGNRNIEVEMRTSAPAAKVWEAWTNPKRLSEWFTDDARGDVRPGEIFTWVFDSFGAEIPYQVVEVIEGERLVLGPVPGAPPFALEISIVHGDGETILRLVNSGFDASADWDEEYDGIVSGWRMALAILRLYVERQFGKPRTSFLVMRPAAFEYSRAVRHFTDPSLLAGWLVSEGSIGGQGDPVNLSLRDGRTLTGEVLVATNRELAVTWEEINGALELKAFTAGPAGRMLCLRGCGWDLDYGEGRSIERELGAALDRLVPQISS